MVTLQRLIFLFLPTLYRAVMAIAAIIAPDALSHPFPVRLPG